MAELGRSFVARALPGAFSEDRLALFLETYLEEWNTGVRSIPGLPDLLGRLVKKFRLAVITNTHDARLVPRHLERMGVADLFEGVVTSVEHGFRKPHPTIFESAVSLFGTEPGRCLHVGDDAVADYHGAVAAGLRALWVDPHGGAEVPEPARIQSILHLEGHLASGGGGAW
jgi:putative hydrolase of the HAD superfamily